MDQGWFDKPVPIAIGIIGDIYYVMNAKQAHDVLQHHWPRQGTDKFKAANRACLEVIAGAKSADVARLSFVEAAREAAVLAD
ncbi:DUF982 domain-containing protein [Aquamicrobium sp. LC103]|uniref:DUF982 domain-containing protein n=1 Tax=Aquamicrobium sp. LC103 TaxID=1120658 RepID=UPI00063EA485|nr:DUF982 domain-containing protein [Aquamicrobium sp. LC103]TKT74733.1 DUF982 domain-containing protein [Aquamicrobium sp. LC103]